MAVDFKESATRKIGPLPVWGWAIAVAGAVIGVRMLRGGGASATSSGTPTIVGGSGLESDLSSADFQGELSDLISENANLSTEVETLTSTVSNFSLFDSLQQQLNAAIISRTNLDKQLAIKRDQIANIKNLYRTKKINKSEYQTRLAKRQGELATIKTKSSAVDTTIADLQKKIASIGA